MRSTSSIPNCPMAPATFLWPSSRGRFELPHYPSKLAVLDLWPITFGYTKVRQSWAYQLFGVAPFAAIGNRTGGILKRQRGSLSHQTFTPAALLKKLKVELRERLISAQLMLRARLTQINDKHLFT